MKLTSILVLAMAVGTAAGQNPDIIQNTKNTMNAVEQKKEIDSNAALAASQGQPASPSGTTTAAKPAPAVKPATAAATPAKTASARPVGSTAAAATKPATATVKPATASSAKPSPTPAVKPATASASKPSAPTSASPAVKPAMATASKGAAATVKPASVTASKPSVKPAAATTPVKVASPNAAHGNAKKPAAVKPAPPVIAAPKTSAKKAAPKEKPAEAKAAPTGQKVEVEAKANPDASKDVPKSINLTGRRDPFISPVVNRAMVGSGCSTGKKCLAIDQIILKGVVKSDTGMIAVVVNSMNKAYFLRENDPVFNGYVVKITGDAIVFKETIEDKLGKPLTREVTKKITTSAV